ncbi:hypothetical protein V6N13_120156 [Hibiscus sabdariffa]
MRTNRTNLASQASALQKPLHVSVFSFCFTLASFSILVALFRLVQNAVAFLAFKQGPAILAASLRVLDLNPSIRFRYGS